MSRKQNKKIANYIRVLCLSGALVAYSASAYAVVANNTLPTNGQWLHGGSGFINKIENGKPTVDGNVLNVIQNGQNAVIQWGDFSIGANATVNFSKDGGGQFNILNYVDSGKVSEIYGAMNAKDGNVFVANTAGIVIGKSAQINVGSLYVTNKKLDESKFSQFNGSINNMLAQNQPPSAAELMSLGNINAQKVTFDGDRVVLDTDRLSYSDGKAMAAKDIIVKTNNEKNIVIGYSAYDAEKKTYAGKNNSDVIATVNDKEFTKADGYMWVKNIEQLQAINTNLGGNYAINDSIDAIVTKDWNSGKGFVSIGNDNAAFTGKFDGLDYSIFGLTINRANESNVGLFGVANGATINNVTLVSGNVTGGTNVGAALGSATGTELNNIVNSAHVVGSKNVGGVIGSGDKVVINGAINTAPVKGHENVGGLAGELTNESKLVGQSYNLGAVMGISGVNEDGSIVEDGVYEHIKESASGANGLSGEEFVEKYSHNIGGLVGSASNSTLGDGNNQIFNQLDVTGGYNVGGIAGSMENSTVTNAANNGNITATGYTSEDYIYHGNKDHRKNPGEKSVKNINVANVGGITGNVNGSTISNVVNTGNIQSVEVTKNGDTFYAAGNVGGIAGRAENTNISNAENKENEIRGAHNVGGIAGYFGGTWESKQIDSKIYDISDSINNGGDIMATGARNSQYTAQTENVVNYWGGTTDDVIIGNMGGIAGYMYGDNTQIKDSSNRGTIHSRDVAEGTEFDKITESSKAGNAGGVVGKIDRNKTMSLDELKKGISKAAVVDSYNTGNIRGYAGVGGIAGMMYNGEIARSYNSGNLRTTRTPSKSDWTAVNMGGIVGDATENIEKAQALLYDVYNRGEIGDKNFEYGSRHVGGIAGRFSGNIDTAYNKGNIYNTAIVTGGIVGWWTGSGTHNGSISNVFNAGNITVQNVNGSGDYVSLGGIVGATGQIEGTGELLLSNAYNLGTLRSFERNGNAKNYIGGIVGTVNHSTKNLKIDKVYTTGELYADSIDDAGNIIADNKNVKSIYGITGNKGKEPTITNAYYIETTNSQFTNLAAGKNTGDDTTDGQAIVVKKADKDKANSYAGLFDDNPNDTAGDWRIYDGTTPILNAFLPKLAEGDNLGKVELNGNKITDDNVQYGTAYNPFATIINAGSNGNVVVDDSGAGAIGNVDSIIVNGGSLTVNNATNTGNTMYNGILYADSALTLNGTNISLGSISNLYGSSVTINSEGNLKAYGDIIATGKNGVSNVTIKVTGGDIEILGAVTSKGVGESTVIPGIGNTVGKKDFSKVDITNPDSVMPDISTQYSKEGIKSTETGNVTITSDQKVDILLGNLERGYITTGGSVEISGKEVYMDSDLNIGGNLTINGDTTVLDISNIGKVQANNGKGDTPEEKALIDLHQFLDHFKQDGTITMKDYNGGNNSDAIIAVDMWDESKGAFDLGKYDIDDRLAGYTPSKEKHYLYDDLNELNLTVNDKSNDKGSVSREIVNIWVANGEQLKSLQSANDSIKGDTETKADIFKSNIALKNDIDMSDVKGFVSIGTGNGDGFTGKFDGRGNRIIGLEVKNGGLFDTIGNGGKVDDVKIYSSNIKSTEEKSFIGMIAATNKGTISNVTTFGNSIDIGTTGVAGGLVGNNEGTIESSNATNVVQSSGKTESVLGGIAGVNSGIIKNSESNSAITTSGGFSNAMGGITGVNQSGGLLENIASQGIVTGLYDIGNGKYHVANTVGGIAGKNEDGGTIDQAYNDSIVSGMQNVGGIVGKNEGTVSNLANATYVYGGDNVGGVAGVNKGSMTNGRNNGSIIGGAGIKDADNQVEESKGSNVGGLVGIAGKGSTMKDLTNDMSAEIEGKDYVGGLIGTNLGNLNGGYNLMNKSSIKGNKYVGGITGVNAGTITDVDIDNAFKFDVAYSNSDTPQYFGGIAGLNIGTITNANNNADLVIDNVTYVGGIAGQNGIDDSDAGNKLLDELQQNINDQYDKVTLTKTGTIENVTNNGSVSGNGYVGGVVGLNADNGELTPNADGIIKNTGEVKSKNGAGGIIGENHAAFDGLKMENSGTVTGNGNDVGGLIGYNTAKGNITNSSLTNSGVINGETNVGGVIGRNEADITTTSVINTIAGTVNGETNIGGLIGTNTGSVQGGRDDNAQYYKYQVYNNGTANGTNSVGGLIGENSGRLVAGYNTGVSNGAGVVGGNSGKVDQVFSTTDNGVVGAGNGTVTNSYYVNSDGQQIVDKTDSDVWKQYNGQKNNLLAVFLTKAKVELNKDFNVTYDGEEHKFSAGKYNKDTGAVEILYDGKPVGTITVKDPNAVHSLLDYDNQKEFNNLIQGITVQNADKYEDFLYSEQINTGDKSNPNNLGFNFVTGFETEPGDTPSFEIAKKQLTITLDEIFRKYGSLDSWYKETDKGWSVEGLVDKDKKLSQDISIKVTGDNSVTGKDTGRVTENANGDYTWSADFKLGDDIGTNYEIKGGTGTEHEAISLSNKAYVEKVDLHINVDDKNIAKGQVPDYSGSINMGDIVNGDNVNDLNIGDWGISADNNKLIYEVGTHEGVLGLWIADKFYDINTVNSSEAFTNYKLILDPGTLTVTSDEYQFWEAEDKYAWSKKREERERKAEVYFVSGGMEL